MRVIAIGPNLPNHLAAKGTLHVHAEGCADIARRYRGLSDQDHFAFEADTLADIVEDIYPSHDFDYDPANPDEYEGYRSDIHFAPCVKLPEH